MDDLRVRFPADDWRRAKPAKKKPTLAYNFRRVKGAGVLFVLLWNLLVFSYQASAVGNLVDLILTKDQGHVQDPWIRAVVSALLSDSLPKMLYPFAGWLADGKLGRYKVMRYSLWVMWVGSFLLVLTSIIKYSLTEVMELSSEKGINFTVPFYILVYFIFAVGTAGYHVNVIPFGIDQMEGASGEEISSFIHWYYWTRNFNFGMIMQFAMQFAVQFFVVKQQDMNLYSLIIQMVFLTAAVCLDFTFSSKLHKDAKLHSSIKKVKDVSIFVLRHSQLVGHRKAHTFTYETPPARSDFAKESYGGPFEDEEVEEVVSFWRITVILLAWGFGAFMVQTVSSVQ